MIVSLPAIAFFAVAALSLFWTDDLHAGENVLAYFLLPFGVLVGVVARAPYPPWMTKVLAVIAVALATLFAVVGLIQAATEELWFFSPSVEVSNAYSSYFRVTSLFRDPSLYGRHVVLGIVILVVAVLYRKISPLLALPLIGLLFAGLWFSYSQSSMAALFVVTFVLAIVAGTRSLRLVAALTALVVLLGAAGIVLVSIEDHSARRFTSDRSRRVELTVKVFRDHPVAGVGLGSQPVASQARSEQGGSPTRFVSHTTPLTVAAELGVIGLAAYLALLGGAAALIERVRRLDPATRARAGCRAAHAVRALTCVQRLLRGSGDLARDRRRRELPALAPTTGPYSTRETSRPWALLATLGVLVGITMPGLGSGAWPFDPPSVDPRGVLGPLVRVADREWDLGILRSTAILAGLLVALAAAASWRFRTWPRWAAVGLAAVVCAMLLVPAVAAPGRAPRRDRAVVLHERLDVPDRDRGRPRARRRQPVRP